jgi:hypothetical protein
MTGFMDLKGFLPELDGDNNTFFVTTSVIHVLDIIHDNHISPVREYSFSTGNRSVFSKVRRNKLKKKYKELASNSSSTIPARRSRKESSPWSRMGQLDACLDKKIISPHDCFKYFPG